jgi:small subunit ribosomal protein S14
MAKKAMIEREKKRQKLVEKYAAKRAALKEIANDESKPMEERFKARLKLAKLPRNSLGDAPAQPLPADRASARLLPQAQGQPDRAARAGLQGQIPGMVKSSW